MIVLSATTDKIQVILAGAITTNQLQCVASWRDITATPTYVAGRSVSLTNSTTDVDFIAAPAASTQRVIDFVSIYNNDTASATVTLKFDANGTDYILWKGTLRTLERLEYENGKGFTVVTSSGLTRLAFSADIASVEVATLATDVANAHATPDTIQDVTGLSFPVVSGGVYWFQFDINYTAAATTTGSRWSINGPATTQLCYTSEYSLSATTTTRNANNVSYDLPAAANADSGATGSNKALIEGVIQPSANGTVIARFASEITVSAITAKAGSRVMWQRTL